MHVQKSLVAAALACAPVASAFDIPQNVQNFYKNHISGGCSNVLASGFDDGVNGGGGVEYCGDVPGVVFLHSTNNGGQWADMDVDCDGANLGAGKCANDPSGQGQTAFQDTIASYDIGIPDLDANKHAYIVFGNGGSSPDFDPQSADMKPLSIMAVICNNQLHYGVWGDTNGGTATGEASIAMADLCFPNDGLTGDNGHGPHDVLYIGFTGDEAVPGKWGANWKANNGGEFESSLQALGDKLLTRVQ